MFGLDEEMVTKRHRSCSTGLVLGAPCTIFRLRLVGAGLRAKLGRKPAHRNLSVLLECHSVKDCIEIILWEYLRVRLTPAIPPIDYGSPAGDCIVGLAAAMNVCIYIYISGERCGRQSKL